MDRSAPWLNDTYQRAVAGDYHAPVMSGVLGHADYYLTDAVSFNLFYLYASVAASQAQRVLNEGPYLGVVSGQQWILTLLYDVNPAVRLGIQWDNTQMKFGAPLDGFKNTGTANDYRFSAYYFF